MYSRLKPPASPRGEGILTDLEPEDDSAPSWTSDVLVPKGILTDLEPEHRKSNMELSHALNRRFGSENWPGTFNFFIYILQAIYGRSSDAKVGTVVENHPRQK